MPSSMRPSAVGGHVGTSAGAGADASGSEPSSGGSSGGNRCARAACGQGQPLALWRQRVPRSASKLKCTADGEVALQCCPACSALCTLCTVRTQTHRHTADHVPTTCHAHDHPWQLVSLAPCWRDAPDNGASLCGHASLKQRHSPLLSRHRANCLLRTVTCVGLDGSR